MRRRPSKAEEDAFVQAAGGDASAAASGRGRQPPADHVRLNVNLPVELHRQLKLRAVHEGRSMTEIIEEVVSKYVDN